MVTLAHNHPLLTNDSPVEKLDFQVKDNTNRLDNKVSGKWKKGGQRVDQNSQLCIATCKDGTSYAIFACMRGTLIEINEKLFTDPNILRQKVCKAQLSDQVFNANLTLISSEIIMLILNILCLCSHGQRVTSLLYFLW